MGKKARSPRDDDSAISSISGSKISAVVDEYFECDYETNCTPLYKALEQAIVEEDDDAYDAIGYFLETGTWPKLHRTAGKSVLTAEIQAKTWVTRFHPTIDRKVEWSQLPLHLAIVGGVPSDIIGHLVKLYPQALRCTDDQQMLPLHLALRHGADDEIVAYLLMQFPEAVNAKGKNNRTPVDCALRARDKLRGIILETFVEKTKAKCMALFSAEKADLTTLIDAQQLKLDKAKKEISQGKELRKQLNDMQTDYESLQSVKQSTEESMATQLKEVAKEKSELERTTSQTIEKLKTDKLAESVQFQKRVDTLVNEKALAVAAEQKAKAEEELLRFELDEIQKKVEKAVTAKEWKKVKTEIDDLQGYRLSRSRSHTKEHITDLKGQLQNLESTDDAQSKDLKSFQKSVNKLEKSHETSTKSTEEVLKLQKDIESLRKELHDRSASAQTRSEIADLHQFFESELQKGKRSKKHTNAMKKMIKLSDPCELDKKHGADLTDIKNKLEALKLEINEAELAEKNKNDILALEKSLALVQKQADSVTKDELAHMKRAVEGLKTFVASPKKKDDLVAVSKDVKTLKELLQKKETMVEIRSEAAVLQKSVETELEKAKDGNFKNELKSIKKSLTKFSAKELDSMGVEELDNMKVKLATAQKELREVEEASKTKRELESLKVKVEGELVSATDKTQKDLKEMKKAVDLINLENKASANLKETLGAEIEKASSKSEKELVEMKKAVDSMLVTADEKTRKELTEMKQSIQAIKDLEQKELSIGKQLKESSTKTEQELEAVKKEVDSIKATGALDKYETVRQEMESLKAELKKKQLDTGDEELDKVKKALAEINAQVESKNELEFQKLRDEMKALREDVATSPVARARPSPLTKKGIKRFFTRKSKAKADEAAVEMPWKAEIEAATRGNSASKPGLEDTVTILPPSFSVDQDGGDAKVKDDYSSSDDDDDALPPAVKKVQTFEKSASAAESDAMEVTLAIHRAKVDAKAVQEMPNFNTENEKAEHMLPSAMRKVQSMGPRSKNVRIDPNEVVKSWEKTKLDSPIAESRADEVEVVAARE